MLSHTCLSLLTDTLRVKEADSNHIRLVASAAAAEGLSNTGLCTMIPLSSAHWWHACWVVLLQHPVELNLPLRLWMVVHLKNNLVMLISVSRIPDSRITTHHDIRVLIPGS